MRIHVVYYIFLNPKHSWSELLRLQLDDLIRTGLSTVAETINVMISADHDQSLIEEAVTQVRTQLPTARIHQWGINSFEYPAIKYLWGLARCLSSPEEVAILYFHSKGMNNSDHRVARTHDNVVLTNKVIDGWRECVGVMDRDPEVMKVGYASSDGGWMWFNFWWVRASYACQLEEPVLTSYRYYYEEWLSRQRDGKPRDASACYSLMCHGGKGWWRNPPEVLHLFGQ